jgi:ribulose kinase
VNGIVWEHFSAQQQADEINEIWPEVNYLPSEN